MYLPFFPGTVTVKFAGSIEIADLDAVHFPRFSFSLLMQTLTISPAAIGGSEKVLDLRIFVSLRLAISLSWA